MKINKIHLVYFSPTETGKRNITAAAGNFDAEIVEHNITCRQSDISFSADDLVFFAAPVYSGRIPDITRKRLEAVRGDGTPAVLFAVYGNRHYDDALAELQSVTENNGFITVAGLAVIGQHTFTYKVAANRPDETDVANLNSLMLQVKEKLEKTNDPKPLSMPGTVPSGPASVFALTPKTNSNCSNCHICMDVCPTQALNKDHFDIPDSSLCISCLACVSHCPSNGRNVNPIKLAPIAKTLELKFRKRREIELFI